METLIHLRCLAHRRFSVGKSVGRVAQRLPFILTPFASNCNDRSIIIRLQISLEMVYIYRLTSFTTILIMTTSLVLIYLNVFAIVLAAVSHRNT